MRLGFRTRLLTCGLYLRRRWSLEIWIGSIYGVTATWKGLFFPKDGWIDGARPFIRWGRETLP